MYTSVCPAVSDQQEASSKVRCAQAFTGIVVRQYPSSRLPLQSDNCGPGAAATSADVHQLK